MSLESFLVHLANKYFGPKPPKPRGRDLVLGKTMVYDREEPVILRESARTMHLAVMGGTGVGKSYFLENLIRQDIAHGTGFAVFDVHGDLAENIVMYLAERARERKEILDRIVIIEPFDETHTIGFNPLERSKHTSAFLQAQELAHILRLRWQKQSFGPRTEEVLRSALYTLSACGLTLLELPELLTNGAFRRTLIREIGEKAVTDYWRGRYDPLSEAMQAQVREPLLTRVSAFLADPQVREIVGQRKSTFTFAEAIQKSLWVVINLSKGILGRENAEVLGSLLFTKLELDVLGQARIQESKRKLFAVYADELQNLVGAKLATLIAEGRKYRLSLTGGHQYWRQLSPEMRAAMLGVGSRLIFRVSYQDARGLAGELDPRGKERLAEELPTLERGQAIFRTGLEGAVKLQVEKHDKAKSRSEDIERVRVHSRKNYGTNRSEIRKDIEGRFREGAQERIGELKKEGEAEAIDNQ